MTYERYDLSFLLDEAEHILTTMKNTNPDRAAILQGAIQGIWLCCRRCPHPAAQEWLEDELAELLTDLMNDPSARVREAANLNERCPCGCQGQPQAAYTAVFDDPLPDAAFEPLDFFVALEDDDDDLEDDLDDAAPEALQACIEITSDRVVLKADPSGAFISCRTSSKEKPEAMAGVHSDHVMLIADEASGIPEQVFEAAAGSMSGENAVTILLGNPIRATGYFHACFHPPLSETFWTRKVSCYDSSRVSQDFIDDMKRRYGEDSNAFRTRCLADWPLHDNDALIGRAVVEAAMVREIEADPLQPLVISVDPARFGTDRTAMCKRRGPVVEEIRSWQGVDLMGTAGIVMNEWHQLSEADKATCQIMIDSIGIGAGLVDRLVEQGLPVLAVNVSEQASLLVNCARLRDELWVRVKEWLDAKNCRLPYNEDLLTDLTAPRYSFLSNGKLKVEGKDEMRRRGIRSPDLADALCLGFSSAVATMTGGSTRNSWGKPLKIDTNWIV